MTQRPLLIAVEGCDGTGKTTLVAALVQAFLSLGILAASIKRPAKDALAAFYVQGQTATDAQVLTKMNADCMAALWQAGDLRRQGTPIVIFDRHYISAAIYQGGDDWQGELERQREMWGEPDVWVFCDSTEDAIDERIGQRADDHHANEARQARATRLSRYRQALGQVRPHVKSPIIQYWSIGTGQRIAWVIAPPSGDDDPITDQWDDQEKIAPAIARLILEVTK